MAKKSESVSDLVNRISDDADFKKRVETDLMAKRMGKILFALRCHKGLSQSELAELMNCTQSRVSKLEHSYDDSITLGDLTAFTKGLGISLTVSFHNEMNAAQSIKYHALQIKENLDKLTDLVGDDKQMLDGVVVLYRQLIELVGRYLGDCASRLPDTHRGQVLQIKAEPELIGEENQTKDKETVS